MLRSAVVKSAVLVPVRFVLVCLLTTALLVGLYVLSVWGAAYIPGRGLSTRLFSIVMLNGLHEVYPVAVLISIVVALFPVLNVSRFRFTALFLLTAVSGAALVSGIYGVQAVRVSLSPTIPPSHTVVSKLVYRFGEDYLYAESVVGLSLTNVTVYRHGEEPGFRLVHEALVDPKTHQIRIPETGREYRIADSATSFVHMFQPAPVLESLFADARGLGHYFWGQPRWYSALYLGTVFAFVFCVTGFWFLIRLTRWPLFNGILAFAALRLLLAAGTFLQSSSFREFAAAIVQPRFVSYVAPAGILLIGFFLFVINVLLPPFDRWKREIDSE